MRVLARSTAAVSPVIGTVLILMITILAMGGILAWGLPAIQGLQAHAEFNSVQTQMLQLNQEIRNLRDPQNTRLATISIASGTIKIDPGDRWAVTVMAKDSYVTLDGDGNPTAGYRVTGYDFSSGALTIEGVPTGVTGRATLETVVGGRFTVRAEETACSATCDLVPAPAVQPNEVVRVQFKVGGIVEAETWILNVGRFTYDHGSGFGESHLEMGAALTTQLQRAFMRHTPTLKEPVFTSDPPDKDFFLRLIQIRGSDAVGGSGEFSVLVNLVDNFGVSRGRPLFEAAHFVRIQVDGDLDEAFCNHFLFRETQDFKRGYPGMACEGGDADVVYAPGAADRPFGFEMSHAVVNGFVRPA